MNYLSEVVDAGTPIYRVPLTNIPQTFVIPLAGVLYLMTCKWNDSFEGGWTLDLSDSTTGESLIAGLPLIVGADILAGVEYLGIQGSLFVYTDGDQFSPPTLDNLGVGSNLYFSTSVSNG